MKISLRHLEKSDLDILLRIENDEKYWHLSGTTEPFVKDDILNYISNSAESIEEAQQIRFVIEVDNQFTGLIDLYDYDEIDKSAGVGIFVLEKFRNKGIALESLKKIIQHSSDKQNINTLFARIENDNFSSIKLFEKTGFKLIIELPEYIQKGNIKVDCGEYILKVNSRTKPHLT